MKTLETTCLHDGNRHTLTTIIDEAEMRKMEWCRECGKLMDDRRWKIPLPEDPKPETKP